jgi:hypothetical protein
MKGKPSISDKKPQEAVGSELKLSKDATNLLKPNQDALNELGEQVFTGLAKHDGTSTETIGELMWIKSGVVAAVTHSESDDYYIELYHLDDGVKSVCSPFLLHSSQQGRFESIKIKTDSSR